ncbi:helix-turn-helix domain-containing protein [Aliarcobacter skirrowii]|uniref:helix-turn-helix domain-containing protein n=1 Tax=Aliarcobacter skirrowii TaxID=28200 RepID=UPI002A35BFD7|nr:helix-turn-helix domain-containing protein [Aliarcobacter skirrowii]MDY0180580.1 helix-turn-helix domain-containing protein [Aliarcobacter skirrowii]
MNIDTLIRKLLNYYNLKTLNELADKLETTQSTISGWKSRNAIGALTDTVANKAPEALEYIFRSENIHNFQNSTNVVGQDFSNNSNAHHTQNIGNKMNIDENILKLLDTLYSFAKTNNKIDELKTDLSSLLPKYM